MTMPRRTVLLLAATIASLAVVPAAAASTSTHERTVDVGLGTPLLSTSIPVPNPFGDEPIANLDGCTLAEVDESTRVNGADPADGCTIEYDDNGDNVSEGTVEEGQTYPAGTSFDAFCNVGTIQAKNAVTLG